jgi:hypothetical protein
MEDKTRKKRYLHQASAIATSGRINRPFCDLIPTQASLALPLDGGFESKRVEGFRYKEIMSFASAYSEVAGSEHGPEGPFDTLALTAIEKLNILDVVTCDRIVARISVKRELGAGEPEITTIGSRFERLRIGSHFFDELDLGVGVICESITWSNLQKALQDDKNKAALAQAALTAPNGERIPVPDEKTTPNKLGFSLAPGSGRSSSIKEVQAKIDIPQFGSVYLGEFYISQFSRHLVMLRVRMGCPVDGGTNVGAGGGGGDTYP